MSPVVLISTFTGASPRAAETAWLTFGGHAAALHGVVTVGVVPKMAMPAAERALKDHVDAGEDVVIQPLPIAARGLPCSVGHVFAVSASPLVYDATFTFQSSAGEHDEAPPVA